MDLFAQYLVNPLPNRDKLSIVVAQLVDNPYYSPSLQTFKPFQYCHMVGIDVLCCEMDFNRDVQIKTPWDKIDLFYHTFFYYTILKMQ